MDILMDIGIWLDQQESLGHLTRLTRPQHGSPMFPYKASVGWCGVITCKKDHAKCVGIEYKLSFLEHIKLFMDAGLTHPNQIGKNSDQYQLGRKNELTGECDVGDYEVGNCRYITVGDNMRERDNSYLSNKDPKDHHQWNGYWVTPSGKFTTSIQAAKSENISRWRLLERCNNPDKKVTKYHAGKFPELNEFIDKTWKELGFYKEKSGE